MINILTSANGKEGITKTRIMYEAYLSFAQLREYLSVLLENGLIELYENRKYKTTSKGTKMLASMKTANDLFTRRENQGSDPYK